MRFSTACGDGVGGRVGENFLKREYEGVGYALSSSALNCSINSHPRCITKTWLGAVSVTSFVGTTFRSQVVEDMTEECSKYGTVAGIEIPHVGGASAGVGFVFVKFHTREDAQKVALPFSFVCSWRRAAVSRTAPLPSSIALSVRVGVVFTPF